MSRVNSSQTGQTAPQPCPVNMTWDLHRILKKSIPPENQQTGFNLFKVGKPPPDPPRIRTPLPNIPHLRPNPRAHPYNVYNTRTQTHLLNQAPLSPRAVDSPPTSLGPASVAAPKPAPRTSAGKRSGIASSNSNQRRNKGAAGAGIEVQGPLPFLPYPVAPSHQATPPPPLQVQSSYLAHRSRRTHHRDDGPLDLDSSLSRLVPREGSFAQQGLYAKQRSLNEKLKWIKAAGKAMARRDTGASVIYSTTNTVGSVSAPQRSLAMGSAQSGASYAPRARLLHSSTAAIRPTFSERQRYDGFIPAQVSGARYEQQQYRTASPNPPPGQDQDPQDMQNVDAGILPAPGPPYHNTPIPVEVNTGVSSVRPASRRLARAHAAADGRVVATTSLSTSHGNLASSAVYPEQAGFHEQEDVIRAGTLSGSPVPAESATVWVGVGCDRLGDIPGADAWATESFAGPDGAMLCDTPIANIGVKWKPDSEGTHRVPPAWYTSNPPMSIEWWWTSPSQHSQLTSVIPSELHKAPYEGPRVRVSTYSSLDGAVPGAHYDNTHISH